MSKIRSFDPSQEGFRPSGGQNWNFVSFKNTCNHASWIPDETLLNLIKGIGFVYGLKSKLQLPKGAITCLSRGGEKLFGGPPDPPKTIFVAKFCVFQ